MRQIKKHLFAYFAIFRKAAMTVAGLAVTVIKKIDSVDVAIALIGAGVWWIHPPSALITVGGLLLLIGAVVRK